MHFLNPARDGAVLPILHLNGYKIGNPTVLGRTPDDDIARLLHGHGYEAAFVEGDEPFAVHEAFAATLDTCYARIREIQADARARGAAHATRPRWPVIVLRTPKGWTGPKVVDGQQVEGTFRAHQVPIANVRDNPEHLAMLEAWMRSYEPEKLFDGAGTFVSELAGLAPKGELRMSASPHANGGVVCVPLELPDPRAYAVKVEAHGADRAESTRTFATMLRDVFVQNAAAANFRITCPDEARSNRLDPVFEVENRVFLDPVLATDDCEAPDGRVMEVLSEHNCQGWLEGYVLTGRHGLFVTYEAFAMVSASMLVQHAKWLEAAGELEWRAPVPSLNLLLTSTAWRNDHNGFSHQGPGLIDVMLSQRGTVGNVYVPPDANCLLVIGEECLRSRDHVNLIVIDKQPELQWLSYDDAVEHCKQGASVWWWAGTEEPSPEHEPDIVLACAGDVPTLETMAAAALLRAYVPDLVVRVVNVVDLASLFPRYAHPDGLTDDAFVATFRADTDVVFAFHGFPREVHQLLHGRPSPGRFHVRGYNEYGTTTTPFDMVVLNQMSRYHLALEAVHRARQTPSGVPELMEYCRAMLERHHDYIREHLEDMPEVRDWTWTNR